MKQEFVTLPREVVERMIENMKSIVGDSGYDRMLTRESEQILRAALDQPQNHVSDAGNIVPAGWRLVPVEPTRDMLTTWIKAPVVSNTTTPGLYRSMLAAAPQPPTTEESSVAQPQANQPAMTPIAQRKLDSLLTEGYTISGYSVYHERKHQHGFVTGAGLVGWWKPEGMEYPQPQSEQEPVAWMDAETRVLYCHDTSKVDRHLGFKPTVPLYAATPPARQPLTEDEIAELMMRVWGCASIAPRQAPSFARAIEAAHNIK